MDADENTMRDDSLKRTHQQVDSCESVFLSPDDLQMFGIRAFQVGMTEDGDLQFNPCFFLPEEFRVLKEYPLDPLNMSDMSPLNPRPDYDAILEKCNKVWPEADEAIKNATEEYNELLGSFADDWITHARDTREHVKCQMSAKNRGGMPRSLPVKVSFLDFPPPWMQWRTRCRRCAPVMGVSAGRGRPEWHVLDLLEHDFEGSPMPHAIISVVSDVTADDADQSLTSCEVTAIVATMICRTSHGHCLDGRVHPILVFCYTGRKHGRIIQASHDGQGLTLQYSPLWSFEDETAPVELFVRYLMSEPVGLETSPIVDPMARLSIK